MSEQLRPERSPGMKLLLAALIGFVLMVPLMLVYALVWDRQSQSQTAQDAINSGWGGDQVIAGPVIVVPFRTTQTQNEEVNGKTTTRVVEVEKYLYISPVENCRDDQDRSARAARSRSIAAYSMRRRLRVRRSSNCPPICRASG